VRRLAGLVLVVAACGPAAPRADAPAVLSNTADPMEYDQGQALQTIRRHLRESSAATWTIDLEPSGRFVRRDSADRYEEDFLLADVVRVVYEHREDWEKKHVASVILAQGAENKYRYGDADWSFATDGKVAFAFFEKEAADAVILALRRLAASR
jgi:hypothetical protein